METDDIVADIHSAQLRETDYLRYRCFYCKKCLLLQMTAIWSRSARLGLVSGIRNPAVAILPLSRALHVPNDPNSVEFRSELHIVFILDVCILAGLARRM